ncbi:MAG: hypothetical protein L3K13_03050 [Thermoplasmata archaeon]|nr:hypothetical protein [Thermoplasmata archaeon]
MSRPTAIPLPVAVALLSAALVLSIWANFGLGNPIFLVLGAVGVAVLASLYLISYSRRPMLDPLPELVAPEEFDDPVIEADRASGRSGEAHAAGEGTTSGVPDSSASQPPGSEKEPELLAANDPQK